MDAGPTFECIVHRLSIGTLSRGGRGGGGGGGGGVGQY